MFKYISCSISSMSTSKQFRKEEFSEPAKKNQHKWRPSEDKVLWRSESDRLVAIGLILKKNGLRKKKIHLIRNWFMIELGLYTGLRVMEMANLKIKDLVIFDEHSSIIVRRGKGGKRRDVWINSKFKKVCIKYLNIREKLGIPNTPESYLLVSNKRAKLTTRALEKAFKKCAEFAGLSKHYSIHCLRHTYATFSLEAGVDIRFLQEQMGHASIKTTEMYLSLIFGKNRQALEHIYQKRKGGE
jgi:integrase/recombinase XerD